MTTHSTTTVSTLPLADQLRLLASSYAQLGKLGVALAPTDLTEHAKLLELTSIELRRLKLFADEQVAEAQEQAELDARQARDFLQQRAGMLRAQPLPGRSYGVVLPFSRRPRPL